MSVYRLEIFNQALEPVDFAPIPDNTQIVEDLVTLERYEINCQKLVDVECGHILRIMDGDRELALAVAVSADQTKEATKITAAPIASLLDFETIQPYVGSESTPRASNSIKGSAGDWRGYIHVADTGAWLVSACAAQFKWYGLSAAGSPRYCINDFDANLTADPPYESTTSTDTIDGVASEITGLYNVDKLMKKANVFEVFAASRDIEGRTFRAYMDFTGVDRNRLRIYMRKSANTYVIDTDLPNIIEKEINITTGSGTANICVVKLYKASDNSVVTTRTYYRHADGTINQTQSPLPQPAFVIDELVMNNDSKSQAKNIQNMDALGKNKLQIGETENKMQITVSIDDQVLPLDTIRQLSKTTIIHNGKSYTANYTGCRINGKLVTYYFGNVRTDLTSKLAIAMRQKANSEDVS